MAAPLLLCAVVCCCGSGRFLCHLLLQDSTGLCQQLLGLSGLVQQSVLPGHISQQGICQVESLGQLQGLATSCCCCRCASCRPGICDLLGVTGPRQQPGAFPTQPRQKLLVGGWGLQLLSLEQASEPQSIQLRGETRILLLLLLLM